ncbi:CRIB domain-containing protein RIC10 isoform X5 [Setaria italica]|uniref:CRIB domain-containing protein RIC10 isoform X5 n=1 Tax=Setaria italica TaxID=4555 RepID=UPI000BE53AB1|nr:CRIB domain-containing protein RIC10 isoform X5 [Setaria italica]
MAISMKGIFRGLKIIAQIFMQREHEIEIGYPTDVRHVSHVGFGASGSCPSWMNEFRGAEEVAAAGGGGGGASISSAVQSRQTSWASLDFEQPVGAGVPPPAEASTADISAAHDAGAGAATPRGAPPPKKPATKPKKARASSPGSSSWRSTASSATARTDSDEPRPAGVRAA